MKNYLMFALLIGAASTMAFGQTVVCEDCTHDVSVYMGEGGLIAEADGAEKVVWVTTCDGVTVSGELTPNDDGKVSMLFTDDNGLACDADEGELQLGPIMDGGWYWITDDMNTAVGGLVDKEVLDNATVMLTSAGDGVTMTDGKGAVYLKEISTGRVGILPSILPVPYVEPTTPTPCGQGAKTADTGNDVGLQKNCALGGGETKIEVTSNVTTGSVTEVVRPYNYSVIVSAGLWHTDSGRWANDAANATLGRTGTALAASYTLTVYDPSSTTNSAPTLSEAGITEGTIANGKQPWTIAPSAAYCGTSSDPKNRPLTLRIVADLDDNEAAKFTPELVEDIDSDATGDQAAVASITVKCPSGASSSPAKGVELVPENLFPTE